MGIIQNLDKDLIEAEYVPIITAICRELTILRLNLRQFLEHREQNYETTVARALHRLSFVLEDQGKHLDPSFAIV